MIGFSTSQLNRYPQPESRVRVWKKDLREAPAESLFQGTTTVRSRFSWNLQDSKVALWKDTQAPNLLAEFIFTTNNVQFWTFFFNIIQNKYSFFVEHLKVASESEMRILR